MEYEDSYCVMYQKIYSFKDLEAWKCSYISGLELYRLTNSFPVSEKFGLVSQMRRAVVSISSNIAEGFSRNTSRDKYHFYIMAKGSLTELQSQLIFSRGLEYITEKDFISLNEKLEQSSRLIKGLMRKVSS